MSGIRYRAHSVTVTASNDDSHGICWLATVHFLSGGVGYNPDTGDIAVEGELHTRYHIPDGRHTAGITAAIDTVIREAERLGVAWVDEPCLIVEGDGEDPDVYLPDGWRQTLAEQADRLGWRNPYAVKPATGQ